MSEPTIASQTPFAVDVVADQDYWWCQCGLSNKQPFCDGSHQSTDFSPVKWTATETKTMYFCGCKRSNQQPLCDGSHNQLGSL